MDGNGTKRAANKDSDSSDMAGTSSTDCFGVVFKSKKKSTDSEDSTMKSPPTVSFDDSNLPPLKPLPFDPKDRVYKMSGEKRMLIFVHSEYQESDVYKELYKKGGPEPRQHTDKDVRRLQEVFSEELGFLVEVHPNKKYSDIKNSVRTLSKQDHSKTSCVCVVILTHGDSEDRVLAADRPYNLEILVQLLQNGNDWLVGKPKLFFVQACRGGQVERPRSRLERDGAGPERPGKDQKKVLVTPHADTLILRSSVEGHISWKDDYGSWLIQELCRVVHATHKDLDFLHMTTMLTSLIVEEHITYTENPKTTKTKQTPETLTTLTKLLRFTLPETQAQKQNDPK